MSLDTPALKQEQFQQNLTVPHPFQSAEQREDDSKSSSEEGIERKHYRDGLKYLMSSLFGIILEDTITQLRILGESNNELKILKTKFDWTNLLSIKFDVKRSDSEELEKIDPKRLDCDEYKIDKLDGDRKYVSKVITSTYAELCLERTFKVLEESIITKITLENCRTALIEEEAKHRALRHELNRQLRQQRNHHKTIIYDTDVKIDALKTNVEDSILVFETKNRFTTNWENARTEQHVQTIHDTEVVHSNSAQYYKQRIDHEQRVHMEIELLFNININETLQLIEDWMEKYDKDIEEIDLKIQIKKCAYQDVLDHRIYLEETIVKHDEEMKNWVAFKDERAKALAYRIKMTESAIIVQAWWRGLLVRLQMGPYRVAKRAKAKLAGAAAAAMMKKMGK